MKQESKKSFSFVLFLFSFFILSSFIFYLSSCKRSTEPVYNSQNLQLKVLDVSCTEAWLSLQAKNDYLNKTLKLFKDDKLILEKPLTTEDSLLYVDGLWPNTSYAFKAAVYDGNKLLTRSPAVTATTMDTTSHNFEWQTFEFGGEGGSSSFYDVAIIDENDIWAVGEIYTANDKYNAAHWDGEKWELKKIYYGVWFWTINTVFAFGHDDVWFDGTIKWDGSRYTVHNKNFPLLPNGDGWYKNAMWGTSSEDFYLVGYHGMIAHYDGQQWQRIESGVNTPVNDIWGCQIENERKVLAVTSYDWYRKKGEYKILDITNKVVSDTIPWKWANERPLMSIWFKNERKIYLAGSGIAIYKNKKWTLEKGTENYALYHIRGSDFNNILAVGPSGRVFHYNGISWRKYFQFSEYISSLRKISIKDNIFTAVGRTRNLPSKAIIVIGQK
ncbi:beta propeller repeat protein [Calditrichota bacterium LG25]